MRRPILALAALPLALAVPRAARAEAPVAEGRIETDEGRFEILGRPLRAGDRIELPEGTLVVEESDPDPDDGAVGSFGVVPAEWFAAASAEGRIETEEGHFEILGRPLRAGDRIELPEGTLVVEESDPNPDDGAVGSFGVVPAEWFAAASAEPAPAAEAASPAEPAPGGADCQGERAAYIAELWRQSGIVDVKDPVALLEGLQGGATGPATGYWWFALATDAFRPLAWSSELRARADALSRCVRGQGG